MGSLRKRRRPYEEALWVQALAPRRKSDAVIPEPTFGSVSSSKDGSVGQTYTLDAAWTNVQWYRRSILAPFTLTKIDGATSLTYVATQADINARLVAVGTSGGSQLGAISYQVVLAAPILLESFDSTTGFTAANGSIALNTSSPAQGTGMLEFVPPGTNLSPNATKLNAFALNAPDVAQDHYAFVIDFAYQDDFDAQVALGVSFQMAEGGSSTYQSVTSISGPTGLNTVTRTTTGKMWWSVAGSEVPGFATFVSGNKNLRMQSGQGAPYSSRPRVDGLVRQARAVPACGITFDDIRLEPFNQLSELNSRKLKATWFVPYALVGQANRLTVSQLQAIKAAGHTIGLNLTADDAILTSKTDVAAVMSELAAGRAWLVANGLDSPGRNIICYSNGVAFSNATPVQKAPAQGTQATVGSAVVVMTDTSSVVAGMYVVGNGIPKGTTVVSVSANTSVTLSANATFAATYLKFVDNSGPFHGTKLKDALVSAGVKIGRTTITSPRTSFYARFGLGDQGTQLPGIGFTGGTNLTMRDPISQAFTRGEVVLPYIHNLQYVGAVGDANPNIDVSFPNYIDWLDYLVSMRAQGMDVLSGEELAGMYCNASIPV